MAQNYYEYLHTDSSLRTVGEFIGQSISPAKYFIGKESEFLDVKDDSGISNRDRIFKSYTKEDDLVKYSSPSSIDKDAPLYAGTLLYIPKDQTFNEIYAVQGKDLYMKQQSLKVFLEDNLKNLLQNSRYVRPSVLNATGSAYSITMINQLVQVWIWVRALGRIVNVTKFIRSTDTGVSSAGGTFSIGLSPIIDIEQIWDVSGNFYVAVGSTFSNGRFNTPYFSKYIQQNDIVFIRFEELEVEKDRRGNYGKLYIEKNQLPGQMYDMVGLVDTNVITYSAITNEPEVSISGRDFSKLLVEDGSYFLPFVLLQNSDDFFVNMPDNRRILNRIFVSGEYTGLFFYTLRSIRDSLGFIFNQLTNTGVLPDGVDLFSSYPESAKSKTYQLSDGSERYLKEVEQNGVWQIIKLAVDSGLDDRRIANSDITRPDGTLMEQVMKVCQEPFVEFWGDTFGDIFSFVVRQPPFTKEQILDYINNYTVIVVDVKDVDSFDLSWETEYYSWYQVEAQNSFLGKSNFIAAAYVPVVWLPEYVDAFGNHKKVVPCNYISYQAIRGESGKMNADLFRAAVAEDLKYVVESTCYLPFTRKGSITIKGGDRRIKRGMFINFEATGEIFYVDHVQHSLRVGQSEIDRYTVLTVSRGMVRDYIKGRFLYGKHMSYFNIVNTEYIRDVVKTRIENGQVVTSKVRSSVLVDPDVFNFFISRKQMEIGNETTV